MPTALKKTIGIFCLLVVVFAATAIKEPAFLGAYNLQNTLRWTSLYGIIGIGAALVIVTGGIDLSIGSVIGFTGCVFPLLLKEYHWPVAVALITVIAISLCLGLFHGLLITKLRLQPFVVTLCGLMFYRGMIRYICKDQSQGFGGVPIPRLKTAVNGNVIASLFGHELRFDLPNMCVYLLVIALIAAFFLNRTIWGRYLLALGRNEEAARFSGIRTDRVVILSYIICAGLSGLAGVLFSINVGSAQPSGFGNFYELYAIAAAVLGGCSLRGGEASILGVLVGSALIRLIYNSINILSIPTELEFAIMGTVILVGVAADEVIRQLASRRKRARGFEVLTPAPSAAPKAGLP
jgi:ribose transport system permease protein